MSACTAERHVFGDDSVTLAEGESKSCDCGGVTVALRDGRVLTTVRATLINERINVSIRNLNPGDGR